ncbi:MAG: S9 family peptidase [bacterium]|nr:S9 family peptidase [bacterium]
MKSLLLLSFVFAFAFAAVSMRAEEGEEETGATEEGTDEKHPLTVQDLWAMHRVGSPAVSPDGTLVAFTVTVFDHDDNKGESDLWLVPTDGSEPPRRLTWQKGSDGSPAWSPDGRHLAFTSKRGEDPKQLYLLPMAGGEAEPVTDLPISVGAPKWFPDGKRIAFAAQTYPDLNDDFEKVEERREEQKDDETQARISDRRLLRYWDHYRTDGRVHHVFELDLESREVRDLMPGYDNLMAFRGFQWDLSPDGEEVAFAANATDPPWQKLDFAVFLLAVEDGSVRNLTGDNRAWDGSPYFTPDGRYLLFGRNHRPEIAPDFTRLARYDRKSGEVRELAAEWDHQPAGWQVTRDGATVVFHAQAAGWRNVYKMPIDGGTPELLVKGGATDAVSEAGAGRVIFLQESFHRPDDLYAVSLAGGEPERLTSFNDELLARIDFGTVEDVTFEGSGGEPVQMHVLLPPGFDESKKWPFLMLVHGGPHGAWLDSFHYRWNAALFAAPGYVTAALNFHGSTGFGQAFAESILGNHAEKPFEDVLKATDHMLERGYLDPDRMAAAGGSYGGYMMAWILGHTDRFACLVNHAGVYDLMAQFASDYTWGRSNNYGARPWEDPERIDRYSPSRFAENFETPTLILHGEKDYRVPVTQGINLHGVLTGKGVESRIVIFPDENHWILKPQAAELWWEEVHGWLEKHVGKGAE